MGNLILQGILYYHPRLIKPRPSVLITFDETTGEMIDIKDELSPLEIVASFTDEDLYQYLAERATLMSAYKKSDKKFLMELVEMFDIDAVLYMIDFATKGKDVIVTRAFGLERYAAEAGQAVKNRINNFRMAKYFQ
ncbi:hypothetical protein C0431_12350 [bacterium]|nr:hypothetical protein [bacterium]